MACGFLFLSLLLNGETGFLNGKVENSFVTCWKIYYKKVKRYMVNVRGNVLQS